MKNQEREVEIMELLEIMRHRRSVRNFTGEEVTEVKLNAILEAGLLAASGKARYPWEFIVVRDKDTIKKMVECRNGGSAALMEADVAIVVVADPEKTDVWTEDCSIAMTHMMLEADVVGLGSCWVQGRLREALDGRSTEEFLRELLGYPENYKLAAILALGEPASYPGARKKEDLHMEKIHREKF